MQDDGGRVFSSAAVLISFLKSCTVFARHPTMQKSACKWKMCDKSIIESVGDTFMLSREHMNLNVPSSNHSRVNRKCIQNYNQRCEVAAVDLVL